MPSAQDRLPRSDDGDQEGLWDEDVLGPGFESRRLRVTGRGAHDRATLVRHLPWLDPVHERFDAESWRRAPGTVIYVHGWSDYFANPELARTVSAAGFRFYALDLHGYGRALDDDILARPDIPGYAESMREYREDLQQAVRAIAQDGAAAEPERIVWIGHSTGGLLLGLAALLAQEPPAGLALATPWTSSHVHDLTGRALVAVLRRVPRRWHERPLPLRLTSSYFRSLSAEQKGEWELDPRWRPQTSFPLTVGFLRAAHEGHLRLRELHHEGSQVRAPVLLQTARKSLFLPWWTPLATRRDTVLDVRQVRRGIGVLARTPRVISYDGGLHDIHRSGPQVRERAFADLSGWLREIAQRLPGG